MLVDVAVIDDDDFFGGGDNNAAEPASDRPAPVDDAAPPPPPKLPAMTDDVAAIVPTPTNVPAAADLPLVFDNFGFFELAAAMLLLPPPLLGCFGVGVAVPPGGGRAVAELAEAAVEAKLPPPPPAAVAVAAVAWGDLFFLLRVDFLPFLVQPGQAYFEYRSQSSSIRPTHRTWFESGIVGC